MAFIISAMKPAKRLAIFLLVALTGCQSFVPREVTILDGDDTRVITTSRNSPSLILSEAGITYQPEDRVFANGIPYGMDEEISGSGDIQLQLRRAVTVALVTPQGTQSLLTSALTVGDVLHESGMAIGIHDEVQPPLTTDIKDGMTITFTPARELTVVMGGESFTIQSSAQTVGEALARAGIPLEGLDQSVPSENEAVPPDGQIRVVRVRESILVEVQSIPFSVEETTSQDVAFGQQEILQAGSNGIAILRTRIRFEDGVETSRGQEEKIIVQEPVTRIVAKGSKIALSPVDGDSPYQYWYAAQMYATWYSPCNSGTGGCSYGTASGARAGYGIVAVDYSIYPYLAGMRVYIPGYGTATIGDSGGGPIIETAFGVARTQWIDLGYDDDNIGGLTGWVTVYFLEPAPAEIPYFFQ
jgi:uncharacterized protein YabE (DUF348 family)